MSDQRHPMAEMGEQIRRSVTTNLKGLMRFSGRQTSGQFWPYAGLVLLIGLTVAGIGFMGPFTETLRQMQQFALEHPDQATITTGPGTYRIEIRGDAPLFMNIRAMLWSMMPGALLIVVLLAASVTRRLHDTGLTGLLGLVPIALAALTARATIAQFDIPIEEGMRSGLFQQAFALSAIYNLSIVGLIVLLCRKGTPGENSYGPPPGVP